MGRTGNWKYTDFFRSKEILARSIRVSISMASQRASDATAITHDAPLMDCSRIADGSAESRVLAL